MLAYACGNPLAQLPGLTVPLVEVDTETESAVRVEVLKGNKRLIKNLMKKRNVAKQKKLEDEEARLRSGMRTAKVSNPHPI